MKTLKIYFRHLNESLFIAKSKKNYIRQYDLHNTIIMPFCKEYLEISSQFGL